MDKKTLGFTVYFVLLTLLAALPQALDWSNWILGLPFSMFWQFLIAAASSVGFILWYVADARSGNLDVGTDTAAGQVDAMPNREPTMTGNQTEAKEGESR